MRNHFSLKKLGDEIFRIVDPFRVWERGLRGLLASTESENGSKTYEMEQPTITFLWSLEPLGVISSEYPSIILHISALSHRRSNKAIVVINQWASLSITSIW